MQSMSITVEHIDSLGQISAQAWDALTDGSPLISHAFLSTLEKTSCVTYNTGWQPFHLIVRDNDRLIGAMPLYLKSHSYGEYVFDWSWADAYERNGLAYYPKLLCAIPFSPITGARLLSTSTQVQTLMLETLQNQMQRLNFSSTHILFTDDNNSKVLSDMGWLARTGVQFRWMNENFIDFEDFLSRLSHDKRKKIHQERKKVKNAGVICQRLTGKDISSQHWDFFYQCYANTYIEHRSTPYLSPEFFHKLAETMPENLLLIIAEVAGEPIAAALNLYGTDKQGVSTLYGRYWGALRFVSGLHFELCYYQAQEFCIERGIQYFEGGAQGEHKLARGFQPRITRSFHKIAHPEFASAIANFVSKEGENVAHYQHELEERAPFKTSPK